MQTIKIPDSLKIKHLKKYAEDIRKGVEDLVSTATGQKKAYYKKILDYLPANKSNYYAVLNSNLLTAPPNVLHNIISEISQIPITPRNKKIALNKLQSVFNYDAFRANKFLYFKNNKVHSCKCDGKRYSKDIYDEFRTWGGFEFIKGLDVSVCPYCNAETVYATTISQSWKKGGTSSGTSCDKYIKSALDHYYSQVDYPYLALSLYNLVPSCTRCNSDIKNQRGFPRTDFFHPYFDSFHDGAIFRVKILKTSGFFADHKAIKIELIPGGNNSVLSQKAIDIAQFFSLIDVYNHIYLKDIVEILYRKTALDNKSAKDLIIKTLKTKLKLGQLDRLLEQVIWGCPLDPLEINHYRFAKIKLDIHNQQWNLFDILSSTNQ